MMGSRQIEQGVLFYYFSLNVHVYMYRPTICCGLSTALSSCRNCAENSRRTPPRWDCEAAITELIRLALSRLPAYPIFVVSISTAMYPIIPPSRRTGTVASATAICCGAYSRRFCSAAFARGWLAGMLV